MPTIGSQLPLPGSRRGPKANRSPQTLDKRWIGPTRLLMALGLETETMIVFRNLPRRVSPRLRRWSKLPSVNGLAERL